MHEEQKSNPNRPYRRPPSLIALLTTNPKGTRGNPKAKEHLYPAQYTTLMETPCCCCCCCCTTRSLHDMDRLFDLFNDTPKSNPFLFLFLPIPPISFPFSFSSPPLLSPPLPSILTGGIFLFLFLLSSVPLSFPSLLDRFLLLLLFGILRIILSAISPYIAS